VEAGSRSRADGLTVDARDEVLLRLLLAVLSRSRNVTGGRNSRSPRVAEGLTLPLLRATPLPLLLLVSVAEPAPASLPDPG
jgi:hypothetical protein